MTLVEKQAALIDDLLIIPDVQERLAALVQRGDRHQLPEAVKTPERRVPGCVSGVWLEAEFDTATPPRVTFTCDADSPMVKGLAALLCDLYSGATAAEVRDVEPEVWRACGFDRMLSPTRLNGLAALRRCMVERVGSSLSES